MSSFANPKRYILKWFAAALRKRHPQGFTTKEAQLLYLEKRRAQIDPEHLPYNGRYGDPTWPNMNARNALCCMVQTGMLRRWCAGYYLWPDNRNAATHEDIKKRNAATDKKLLRLQKREGSQSYLQMISRVPYPTPQEK